MISKDWVIKKYEGKAAQKLVDAPISALQGVSEADAKRMKESFGIDNIAEMAALKYYQRAKAIKKEAENK